MRVNLLSDKADEEGLFAVFRPKTTLYCGEFAENAASNHVRLRLACSRWCVDLKSVEFDFAACGAVFHGRCAGRPNRAAANELPASEQERIVYDNAARSDKFFHHLFQFTSAFC